MLHEEWLVHFFDRIRIFADGCTNRVQANRSAIELLDDRPNDARIHVVEAERVDVEQRERLVRDVLGDHAVSLHLRVVTHAAEQAVGDPRRAARAPGDLVRAIALNFDFHHVRGAAHDELEIFRRIEVEPLFDAEARAHGRGEHTKPRRSSDERERLDRHCDSLRLGPVRQANVDLVVLHRGIEELLDDRAQPVNFVDEQDVARPHVRERRDEIAWLLQRRARARADVHAELASDQLGERCLPQSRRPEEERVVERLTP
jgi:hypothetical protein